MTVLLDIAALGGLVLALTFVPALGHRADRRITKQLERAEAGLDRPPAPRPAPPARPARAAREGAGRSRGPRLTNPASPASPRTSP